MAEKSKERGLRRWEEAMNVKRGGRVGSSENRERYNRKQRGRELRGRRSGWWEELVHIYKGAVGASRGTYEAWGGGDLKNCRQRGGKI